MPPAGSSNTNFSSTSAPTSTAQGEKTSTAPVLVPKLKAINAKHVQDELPTRRTLHSWGLLAI
jgi:hypothetical protein